MSNSLSPAAPTLPPLDLPRRSPLTLVLHVVGWAAFFALISWAWKGAEMAPEKFLNAENRSNMVTFSSAFFPPDLTHWKMYATEMVVTVQIAIWGTLLSVICAVPMSLLCSTNLTPAWLNHPARRLMDASRAVNEMVFALLFVSAVGLGPFAGVLALFIHTTGVLAKLFSESVEAIDPQPVEGIRATGANRMEEISYGVIPQVLPHWLSHSLYRFESNLRSATVLGIVGAGGIGHILWDTMRNFEYASTAAILIMIILTVSVLDTISGFIRRKAI